MAYKDNEKTVGYDAHLYSKNGNVIANKNLKSEEGKVDLKDKVIIGPFSRNGKNRNQVEACDHELTNHCLIPLGILD